MHSQMQIDAVTSSVAPACYFVFVISVSLASTKNNVLNEARSCA